MLFRTSGSNRAAVVLLSNSMHYWCLVTGPKAPIAPVGRCAIVQRYRRRTRRHPLSYDARTLTFNSIVINNNPEIPKFHLDRYRFCFNLLSPLKRSAVYTFKLKQRYFLKCRSNIFKKSGACTYV